jgi:DNA helicase-2/ATP-dependent DNA helicase PcrA
MQSRHVASILEEARHTTSDDRLDDVDTPFRILAGPGAGKTYWLVEHIKEVIKRSDLLGPKQRIACISYTRVAAGEIEKELGSAAAHVDVSTIHSFLYRNIVKPYLPWIRDESGNPVVDYWHVDGHSPHQPVWGIVDRWIQDVSEMPGIWAFDDEEDIRRYLSSLRWEWDRNAQEWELTDRGYPPDGPFPSREANLREYKKQCWQAGILDHEDVLYFAVRILNENPNLTRFLSARHPYVFVDEFQDTTPAQTEVLRRLAANGSVTGVIGDIEQSIFEFAGAKPQDLRQFEPDEQKTFRIVSNRRSTHAILDLLNHVRQASSQILHVDEEEERKEGDPPVVLVGSPETAQDHVKARADREVQTLVRSNILVRRLAGADIPKESYDDSWEKLRAKNPYRTEWLEAVLEAIREVREQERYGEAVHIIYRGLRTRDGKLLSKVFTPSGERRLTREDRRRTAANFLPLLLEDQDRHFEMSGLEFYRSIRERLLEILPDAPMVDPGGEYAELLEDTSCEGLYATARLQSGDGQVKTIHKSKGEQYPVVLVHRGPWGGDPDAMVDHLLMPEEAENREDREERRVTYVGLSRAENKLYICVEKLARDEEVRIKDLGLIIRRLSKSADDD